MKENFMEEVVFELDLEGQLRVRYVKGEFGQGEGFFGVENMK